MTQTHEESPWTPAAKRNSALLLAAWAAIAFLIGVTGVAKAPPDQLFRPIALTVIVPVALFGLAYLVSARARRFVLAQDLRVLTMLQLWRVLGFSFLLLYAVDALPGLFAFPAGIGDLLVGVTAPFVVARMMQSTAFARSRRLVAFHALGLLDFVVAVAAATASSGAFPGLVAGGPTSAPMEVWPLNIFPSLLVPLFIMMHLTVFLKVRALNRAARGDAAAALQPA